MRHHWSTMATFALSGLALLLGPMNLGFPELVVLAVVGLFCLPLTALWIWALVDCATKEPDTGNTKLIWILIIALTHIIGAILYFAIRRPERKAALGR
jgi:hypothetical protein